MIRNVREFILGHRCNGNVSDMIICLFQKYMKII